MSPLATSQPSGSHRRSPQPCSHGCSLPRKPCLLQSHREAGFPLPEPQILLLVAGKGFPNAAGWGCAGAPGKVQREGGRMEGRKEGALAAAGKGSPGVTWLCLRVLLGLREPGSRREKREEPALRDRDLSARRPSRGHLHQHRRHRSSLFSPRILPAPSSLLTPSRAGMMTAPAPCGAPGQHPSIKPFPAARAGAGSRRSIDLIKPCAIHPRSHDSSS